MASGGRQLTFDEAAREGRRRPKKERLGVASVERADLSSVRVETPAGEKYFVVLQTLGYGEYLLRQILKIDVKSRNLKDETFEEETIKEVRQRLGGIAKPEILLSWGDLLSPRPKKKRRGGERVGKPPPE